jgi:transcriptional regulator with XRE-family HTH domain
MPAKEITDARSNAQKAILNLIASRIRSAMEDEGETYRSVAKRAGVSAGTVSNILKGEKDPGLLKLLSVVAALGFSDLESVFGDIELPTRTMLLDLAASSGSATVERDAG